MSCFGNRPVFSFCTFGVLCFCVVFVFLTFYCTSDDGDISPKHVKNSFWNFVGFDGGIQSIGETYYSVGGINVPKKISCLCTDGVKRPQLVKGNDDLRQDAVMQQVFTIMNSLLRENKDTLKRRLLIRTYKVVPLSQRSGVIEWCSNTVPLSTYLIGGGGVVGAHTRYRKNDWSPNVCRQLISDVAQSKNLKKLATFKEICANFKPVFRQFFFEKFSNPGTWFERKLAYTHSVATSSMVGYILGIGDRHILNILVDELTAEVIHIDFGIAFEQGRTLVTPETVPFRLTRDIIDGMGVSGVEGVFRRSCEKTLVVLRECQSTIVTILEVLLYDPLYMWTITPGKAIAKQSSKLPQTQPSQALEESKVNKLAERALLRLKQKLQGIEEGSITSVEGQVSMLIQEATDPANLCRLFQGWQAHV